MADWTLVGHIWRPDQDFTPGSPAFVEASRYIWWSLAHLIGMTDFTSDGLERMLTTSELADYLNVSRQVIYDLRHEGHGPRGIHVGKELRYRISDIMVWIDLRSDPIPKDAGHAR